MLGFFRNRGWEELMFLPLVLIFTSNLFPFNLTKLLFIIPLAVFFYLFRISTRWALFSLAVSCVLVAVQQFLFIYGLRVDRTYFSFFNRWLPINSYVLDYLKRNYSKDVYELMGLIVFNRKNRQTYGFFKDLGIAHLVSVSGIHFSTLSFLLIKFLRKRWIVLVALVVYWAAIDYSIPALRVILGMLLARKGGDKLREWSKTALLSLAFNIHIYSSLSFLLSYFFSLLLAMNGRIFRRNISLWMANALFTFVFSTIAFLPFNPHRIYPLAMFNTFIFAPIVLGLFIYFAFTWFWVSISPLHSLVIGSFDHLRKIFGWSATFIEVGYWDYGLTHLGLSLFGLLLVILLRPWFVSTIPKIRVF